MSIQLKRKRPYARKSRTKLTVAAKPQEVYSFSKSDELWQIIVGSWVD